MPSFCCVLNCGDKYAHGESISFHKFPFKRKDLLLKWIEFTRRGPNWKPSKWSSICSRHFISEEFGGVNSRRTLKKTAVPTVPPETVTATSETLPRSAIATREAQQKEVPFEPEEDVDDDEISSAFTASSVFPKTNCRLCGICCRSVATFATNFEIFGMIQKCFPTLNIQQDDNLPKDMCTGCLKRLNHFSEFIDKVFETQRDFQKNFRLEKSIKPPERPLKIKQEPVVKVKQEATEAGDSFFSDELDMVMDDCYQDSCEQKFPFLSDFPMLNAQDIINNCDIMEIINLDDPFIDIPDDDGTTAAASNNFFEKRNEIHSSNKLRILYEDHNYAAPLEETKDTLQIEKFYKTEKTETRDEESNDADNGAEINDDLCVNNPPDEAPAQLMNSIENYLEPDRNIKPIVTSVNAIAEPTLQIPRENGSGRLVVTSISDLLPATRDFQSAQPPVKPPNYKPNIVVLNESIVKTGSAFQLHSCNICHLQFFTQESLNNHNCLTHSHTTVPMVSLPWMNIPRESNTPMNLATNSNTAISCSVCFNSFNSIYDLLRHKHKMHPNVYQKKPFFSSCPRCEKFFISKISLSNHIKHICNLMVAKLQKTAINFKCRYCPKAEFNHWRLLRYHEINCKKRFRRTLQQKKFKCKTCKRIYLKKTSLTRHESHHRPPKRIDVMCTKCNKTFNFFMDLRQHYSDYNSSCKQNTASEIYVVCMTCNMNITSLTKMRTHRHTRRPLDKSNNQIYSCPICKKTFFTLNNLGQHRITHSEEKRHKCELCGRVFKRRGGLTQHMKGYHLKMKPHECGVCKRCYALKADMMRCRHSLLKIS